MQAVSQAVDTIGSPELSAYMQSQPLFRLRPAQAIAHVDTGRDHYKRAEAGVIAGHARRWVLLVAAAVELDVGRVWRARSATPDDLIFNAVDAMPAGARSRCAQKF